MVNDRYIKAVIEMRISDIVRQTILKCLIIVFVEIREYLSESSNWKVICVV